MDAEFEHRWRNSLLPFDGLTVTLRDYVPLPQLQPGVIPDYAAIGAGIEAAIEARRAMATKSVCWEVHQAARRCNIASAPSPLQRMPGPFIRH